MRLRRLVVSHFAGIRTAEIEFAPGLNVLHGPNELGKSSLLRAIRAALLLQSGASAHEEFVDWHADQPPLVMLEFETEPQHIWRVEKCFGKRGSSQLEFSKDGTSFSLEVKGRQVDERLRELLSWGLAAPGGSSRKKGYPASFLTTALLAEQGDVDAVLARGLEDDDDESGRKRLAAALQALAEDPLFRRVLERTQQRVNEAYTTTGQRSRRKDSPWKQLKERRIAAEKRRDEVRASVEESESARDNLSLQAEKVDTARVRVGEERTSRERIETAWKHRDARRDANERLDEAQEELKRVQEVHDAVVQTGDRLKVAGDASSAADERCVLAETNHGAATAALEAAKETLREVESDNAEQKRKLREQEIENSLLGLEPRANQAARRAERAQRVGGYEGRVLELSGEVDQLTGGLGEAGGKADDLQRAEEESGKRRVEVQRALLAQAWLRAEDTREEAQTASREVAASRTAATEKRAEAEGVRREVAGWRMPSIDDLLALRELQTQVRVAEERLAVGLSVRLEPHREIAVKITEDEEESEHRLREAGTFEARSRMSLQLPDLDVHIVGGGAEAQAQAEDLRARWAEASLPVFTRTGLSSLEELDQRAGEARERLAQVEALVAEATALDARADGAGDVEATLQAAGLTLDKARGKVEAELTAGTTLEEARTWATGEAKEDDLEQLEQASKENQSKLADLNAQLSRDGGILESKQAELEALKRERDKAAEGLTHAWQVELQQAQAELADVNTLRERMQAALREVGEAASTKADEAREGLAAGEVKLAEAADGLKLATEARDLARREAAALEGELRTVKAAAEKEDLASAGVLVEQRREELVKLPEPEAEISDQQRDEAGQLVRSSEEELRAQQDTLRKFEGGLEQVGGQYVEEQMQQAEEAVLAVDESEHEKELDFGAWQLLLETLKEAESEAAVHLGKAVVEPIERRMSELTGGRYGAPAIGPKLTTGGIELAGTSRPLDALSIGTREQLATLLRLTIAEKLGSVVVLDDQLVQSDPERMKWLVAFMQECAAEFQIVVLTCQPAEYKRQNGGGVTFTDLAQRMERTDAIG
jgi:DNA repair exonuclease SbcCD ATPase subunit